MESLPFSNLNNDQLRAVFDDSVNNIKTDSSDLKRFLFTLSQNDLFTTINNDLFTCLEFNNNFSKISTSNLFNFKVLHINIHSLNAKLDGFCDLINCLDVNFDIIVLTEIWCTNVSFFRNLLPSYIFYYDLPVDTNVGGVGMFIKNDFTVHFRNDLRMKSTVNNKIENLWLEVSKNKTKFVIGGVYRHPSSHIAEFSESLEVSLSKISRRNVPCIVAADMNIDLLKFNSLVVENYIKSLLVNNFLPVLLAPTRVTLSSATIIDHIYLFNCGVNFDHSRIVCGNLCSDLSDHFPNYILLNSKNKCKVDMSNRPSIRLFSELNKANFKNELSKINWYDVFQNSCNANECYDNLIAGLTEIFNQCFPLTRISRKAYRNKLWFSVDLKKIYDQKNTLYKKWSISRSYSDKEIYLKCKKEYQKHCKQAKIAYYKNLFNKSVNSTKDVWKNLMSIVSTKNSKCTSNNNIDKIVYENVVHENSHDIANAINKYFCSVGECLSNSILSTKSCFTDYLDSPLPNSIFVEDITCYELSKYISELQVGKACGDDGLSVQLIKDNQQYLLNPLVYIFNMSLSTGIVPTKMKLAKVIPLYKDGDITLPSNYRPISLLNIFSKLLEKIVYNRLYNFFTKEHVIYKYQFGFRANHSTSLSLLEVADMCYSELDKNNYVLGLFVDLRKAFDTVNHDILLAKLYNYGIRGVMYNWLCDYLSNRRQYTTVNGNNSDIHFINCGVPQGSVLGPLLFLIYVNDIQRALPNSNPKLFADDTNIFVVGKSLNEVELKANECLNQLQMWCSANKLTINFDKTCYTVFTPKNNVKLNSLSIYVGNKVIQYTNSCKYLGVIIDNKLNWIDHINSVYNKIVKFVSIFYKIRDLLPDQCRSMIYYSFVHSNLLYGIEVYGNTYYKNLSRLCLLNNKLIRILFDRSKDTHVSNLYNDLGTLPINLLHEYKLLCFVHKCIHHKSLLPDIFSNYFQSSNMLYRYSCRRKFDLFIKSVNSHYGEKCILFKGSSLWNKLPESVKTIINVASFKNTVKHSLQNSMNI